jgi:phage terminase large subunit-like protein
MPATALNLSSIASLPPSRRAKILNSLTNEEADALLNDWSFNARPEQVAPEGDWQTWLILAGRGFGKTRSGSEWVRDLVKRGVTNIGLIAPTAGDIRDVMIEGISGILATSWAHDVDHNGVLLGRPTYEPSLRHKLTWANGAVAHGYSAEEPDRLRGPNHMAVWCDEVATWKDAQEVWDMMMFGLRLGRSPRVLVTTTPKPIPLLREIIRASTTIITKGKTYDNRANLAEPFLKAVEKRYAGTRLGRQELDGEMLEEAEGALWSIEMIDRAHFAPDGTLLTEPPEMKRIVVAIDPAITAKAESNLTGIVVAGLGVDGRGYVLADGSGRFMPGEWAKKAVSLYDSVGADRIVAEGNQGGEMVRHTILTERSNIPVKIVHASHGKNARAEPVQALYEQNRISHVGRFEELERQMCVAPDTLITTDRGDVAISKLRGDEKIATREGYRSIKWCGRTGIKKTLVIKNDFGFYVKLTEDHPIFIVGRGFVRADKVKIGDETLCLEKQSNHSLILKARDTLKTNKVISGRAIAVAAYCFIAQCGEALTGRYHATKKSIISMATHLITNCRISNVSRDLSIAVVTPSQALQLFLRKSEASCESANGPSKNLGRLSALNAVRHTKQMVNDLNSAQCRAEKSSIIVEIKPGDVSEVWDLTVNDTPEFFANGILLHNCTWEPLGKMPSPDRLDALVWAFTELMVGYRAEIPSIGLIQVGAGRQNSIG